MKFTVIVKSYVERLFATIMNYKIKITFTRMLSIHLENKIFTFKGVLSDFNVTLCKYFGLCLEQIKFVVRNMSDFVK